MARFYSNVRKDWLFKVAKLRRNGSLSVRRNTRAREVNKKSPFEPKLASRGATHPGRSKRRDGAIFISNRNVD